MTNVLSKSPKEKTKSFLAVDTSSLVLSIAIQSHDGARYELNLKDTPRHAEHIIGFIQDGLKIVKMKKSEIDFFLWGMGPGSFTGLRIGMSLLKGFHFGFQKSSFGTSSLDLIAGAVPIANGKLGVMVDARREKVYFSLYEFENGTIKKTVGDLLISIDELIEKLDPDMTLTGDALRIYGEKIRLRMEKEMVFLSPDFWYPRALSLISLFETGNTLLKPLTAKTMLPQYLRTSEAEEKLLKTK